MKKPYVLIALAVAGVIALPLVGYSLLSDKPDAAFLSSIVPAAGLETPDAKPSTHSSVVPAETTAQDIIPSQSSLGLNTAMDSDELPPLRITPDKPEVITLDRDAINVLVGSNKNLRVVPDTNRTLVLIPKQPGSTYFKALDAEGKVIMQRHVIVGSPKSDYIRVRRACVNGAKGCQQYSVYYCPDMCHEVSVTQGDDNRGSPSVPQDAPLYRPQNGDAGDNDGVPPEESSQNAPETADTLEETQ